jgi:glycosyltransferase involved in cell wall biosynthesis
LQPVTEVEVVIPAWNEAGRIAHTVRAARSLLGVTAVLVVDDGSTDATAVEARDAGAGVLSLPKNIGKGKALQVGVKCSRSDIVLLLDADLEDSAAMAQGLIDPVMANEADMTIAGFVNSCSGGFGLAQGLARWGIKMLTGLVMQSPLSGQRAMRRAILERVDVAPGWGTEVALTIDACRLGYRVQEIPLMMRHRSTGRTWRGFVHRGRQLVGVAQALMRRLLFAKVTPR